MNFLVDAQLPLALSEWLCQRGHDSTHTTSLPKKNSTTDSEVLQFADREERIVVSKDSDFYDSFILTGSPKKLLLISTGNISNRALIEIFEANLDQITNHFGHHTFIELNALTLIIHR